MASVATNNSQKFIRQADNHGRTNRAVYKRVDDLIPDCYDSGGILFNSKTLMALYRRDPHVKSLVQNHAEKLKCIWQHSVPLLRCLYNSFASQYETLSEELNDDDNMDDAISQCFEENLLLPNPTLLQWEHNQILQKKGIPFDGLSQSYHHLLVTKQRDYYRCTPVNQAEVLETSYLHQLLDFNNIGIMATIA
eukprot:Gb_14120 [translate_table: standard]